MPTGRKCYKDEERLKILWTLSTNQIIWALRSATEEQVPMKDKLEIARSVLIKMIPASVNVGMREEILLRLVHGATIPEGNRIQEMLGVGEASEPENVSNTDDLSTFKSTAYRDKVTQKDRIMPKQENNRKLDNAV